MADDLIKHFMNLICSIYVLKNTGMFSPFCRGPGVLPCRAGRPDRAPFPETG